MERGISVKKLFISLFLFCCLQAANAGESTGTANDIVLIASKESSLNQLSLLEVRKLFIGMPVVKNGIHLMPVINVSDQMIQNTFLQSMVFMTENTYKRQLLKRTIKYGTILPKKYDDIRELIKKISSNGSMVSFMRRSDLKSHPELKVVEIL